jgi:hypothetical protein
MLSRRSILALLAGLALPAYAQDSFKDVERIVAIGDIHGDYDQLVSVLRAAEVIDKSNRWVGGKTFLVQTGDLLDRGADAKKVMDLLIDLEPQAKKAGGRVLSLLGNHETMNLYGDLRYVIPEDFETFITGKMKPSPGHPSGWADRKKAFETDGQYGKWMRQKNAIVKINDIVFLHGGISPKYEKTSISTINNEVREELSNFDKLQGGMVQDPEGPLWYRGLAQLPDAALGTQLEPALKTMGAQHIVIGHSIQPAIMPRAGGKVITIDVGMSKVLGGPAAALIIENGKFYALHRGTRLELPLDNGDVVAYLKSAAALDPQPSPIQSLIETKARELVSK